MILPTPEDPVYRAAVYIDLHCKVVTPGNYFFNWEAYCLEGGSERLVFHGSNFSDISHLVSVSSTPDTCLDVIVCRAWDDRGSSGEARFTTGNITGELGEGVRVWVHSSCTPEAVQIKAPRLTIYPVTAQEVSTREHEQWASGGYAYHPGDMHIPPETHGRATSSGAL